MEYTIWTLCARASYDFNGEPTVVSNSNAHFTMHVCTHTVIPTLTYFSWLIAIQIVFIITLISSIRSLLYFFVNAVSVALSAVIMGNFKTFIVNTCMQLGCVREDIHPAIAYTQINSSWKKRKENLDIKRTAQCALNRK